MKEPTDCAHLGMGSWVGLGWVKNENLKKNCGYMVTDSLCCGSSE